MFLIIMVVLFQLSPSMLFAQSTESEDYSVQQDIQSVTEFFEQGRIDRAEHLALKVLEESETLTDDEKFNLYKTLAFCSIAVDDEESGIRRFVMALRYNPVLSPDPMIWSPKVRRVFERAREDYARQIEYEHQKRYGLEAQFGRQASLRSLYLPGYGQISKGQPSKGYLLGLLFWGSASSFVYSQIRLPALRNSYRDSETSDVAVKRWDEYRDMQYMVNVTGIIALSVYTYTFLDALWSKPAKEKLDSFKESADGN